LDLLRAKGFRLAIDDFGTGYASISRFMRMRPDRLKIDRRFVRDLGTPVGATSSVLVEAVVGIAHQFGVEVVAEGVETEAAMAVLAGVGCDYAQGYLCGRPGSAAAFVQSLRPCPSS
jgi:EAL domain-containing protein (putative c-di-GMP-specific phosphodiesterase class I)